MNTKPEDALLGEASGTTAALLMRNQIATVLSICPEIRSVTVVFDYYGNLNDSGDVKRGLWLGRRHKDDPLKPGDDPRVGHVVSIDGIFGSLMATCKVLEGEVQAGKLFLGSLRDEALRLGEEVQRAHESLRDAQENQAPAQDTLQDLLERLKIDDWDFLVVGDGSGSSSDTAAGWASLLVERKTGKRTVWYGSVNKGTVNLAEIMAYLQPLNWLANKLADSKSDRHKIWQVHIVTDSRYCRDRGESGDTLSRANAGLWAALNAYARSGLVTHWHWIPRDSTALNQWADALSKLARLSATPTDKKSALAEAARPPTE